MELFKTILPYVVIGAAGVAAAIVHRAWLRKKLGRMDWDRFFLLCLAACTVVALGAAGLGAWNKCPKKWVYKMLEAVLPFIEGNSDLYLKLTRGMPLLIRWMPVLVPLFTAGTVITLLWNILPHHVPVGYKQWYVFSELEPHSIHMANSLKDKKRLFIFLRTRRRDVPAETLDQLEDVNCWFYPKTESTLLRWHWFGRKKILRFFFLSENTDENFSRMDQFLQEIKEHSLFKPAENPEKEFQQELYLLSETESAPMLIDHLRDSMVENKQRLPVFRNTECRLLDRNRAISYALLQKQPLYDFHDEKCANILVENFDRMKQASIRVENRTNILVLGFGRVGREFFRAASSIGIMPDRWLGFTLCDRDIDNRWAAFTQQCPEMDQPNIITKAINAESGELEKLVNTMQFHYILVALGDDEVNIRVATWLKRYYRRRHWESENSYQPQICVNIEDEIKSAYIKKLWKKEQDWDRDLLVFGSMPEIFSADTLLPRKLWEAAAFVHKDVMDKSTDNWSEYERRSSMACAMHGIYHVRSSGIPKDKLTEAEHHRWMAYARSEGMRLASEKMVAKYAPEIRSHVDVKGKLTPCLVDGKEKLLQMYDHFKENPNIRSLGNTAFWERDEKVVDNADGIVECFE